MTTCAKETTISRLSVQLCWGQITFKHWISKAYKYLNYRH